jgi:hypothetical protein
MFIHQTRACAYAYAYVYVYTCKVSQSLDHHKPNYHGLGPSGVESICFMRDTGFMKQVTNGKDTDHQEGWLFSLGSIDHPSWEMVGDHSNRFGEYWWLGPSPA